MKNVSVGLVVALLLALVVGVGLIQALSNFNGGIELRPAAPALQGTATMSVGAPKNVNSGTNTFEVDVNIADASNLGAYEYDLGFDNTILSVNSVTQGTFLGNLTPVPGSGRRHVIPLGPLTGTPGQVSVGAATCPVEDCQGAPDQTKITTGVNGAGTLSTIKFDVVGRGVTNLTLSNAQITDVDANVQGLNTSSTTIGVFPYPVVTDPSALKYVDAGLPVDVEGIPNADSLANHVGAGVEQVMKWNPTSQSFLTRIPGIFGPNFTLQTGDVVLLAVNSLAPAQVLIVGTPPSPGVQYTWTRGTTGNCKYNHFLLPIGQEAITTADQLAAAIGGVEQIMKWNPASQSFLTRLPGIFGPNFSTKVGDVFLVCLAEGNSTWP